MKTAEEILEKHYTNSQKRIAFPENVVNAMKEYARQACEEQRKIYLDQIFYTPLPELK